MEGASEWSATLGQSWRDSVDGLEATLEPVNDAVSNLLALEEAKRIADIGCGGGGYTRHLARTAPADTQVKGFDISPDLIEVASARDSQVPNLDYQCLNAETDSPSGTKCDRLTSRFGVMFFDNELSAFANLKSWLRPGGRFAFAVWGDYEKNPWQGAIRSTVATYVDISVGTPEQPGPVRYADPERLVALLETVGFEDVDVTVWSSALKLGGGLPAHDAAQFGLAAFWGKELPTSDPNYPRALQRLTSIFQDHETGGQVSMCAQVNIVTGCS